MYKLYIGNISPQRLENWFLKDDNPYGVWEGRELVCATCCFGAMGIASGLLREQVEEDWGSTAWKANRAELTELFRQCGLETKQLAPLEPGKDYAVVFLETVWGDSA